MLNYKHQNVANAKILRKQMTHEEKHLWYDFLSKHEYRFQRQKPIGNYIVDFYCHTAKLIIEIDGIQHYGEEAIQKDATRTNALESLGLTVIRFTNRQINNEFNEVCMYINAILEDKTSL